MNHFCHFIYKYKVLCCGRNLSVLLVFSLLLPLVSGFGCTSRRDQRIRVSPKPTTATAEPSPQIQEEKTPGEPIQFVGTTLQAREGNRKNWELTAKEVTYDEGKKMATAAVVECVFFDGDNQKTLTVTARGAQVHMQTKSLEFLGEVSVHSEKGEDMKIKKLRWDGENKKLIGEGEIRINRNGAVMTAGAMKADPELKQLELSGGVQVIYPRGEEFLGF